MLRVDYPFIRKEKYCIHKESDGKAINVCGGVEKMTTGFYICPKDARMCKCEDVKIRQEIMLAQTL